MAQIRTTRVESQNLTVFTVTGDVTGKELIDATTAYLTGQATLHTLWDCTSAGTVEISSDDIEEIVENAKRLGGARKGGKTAWVWSEQFGYGLSRMATIKADLRAVPFEARVFHTIAEAKSWLGVA